MDKWDMVKIAIAVAILGAALVGLVVLWLGRKITGWVAEYPPGYEDFKTKTSRPMQEKKLDAYLANVKNNDLQGLDREKLIEILCLDHVGPVDPIMLPIERRTQLCLFRAQINSIPTKEIQFLFPNLVTLMIEVTRGTKINDLAKFPTLKGIFIRVPDLTAFPYFLSELKHLDRLQLFKVKIRKISFKNQDPFPALEMLGITSSDPGEVQSVEDLERGLPNLKKVIVHYRHVAKWRRFLIAEYGERGRTIDIIPGS